jgi:hypothetical protein
MNVILTANCHSFLLAISRSCRSAYRGGQALDCHRITAQSPLHSIVGRYCQSRSQRLFRSISGRVSKPYLIVLVPQTIQTSAIAGGGWSRNSRRFPFMIVATYRERFLRHFRRSVLPSCSFRQRSPSRGRQENQKRHRSQKTTHILAARNTKSFGLWEGTMKPSCKPIR